MLALGGRINHQVIDITSTYLSLGVLKTVREVDFLARKVLRDSGKSVNGDQTNFILELPGVSYIHLVTPCINLFLFFSCLQVI